jgi:hypothetical protein
MKAHVFHNGREDLIEVVKVLDEDSKYFTDNHIRVSIEKLAGEVIVYGCPYADTSEESEVIVFSRGRPCEETMAELAKMCKNKFGVE